MEVKEVKARSCHFVMVHGATFGGWCWYKVTDLILKAGHTVSSIDMASGRIDPSDADHISSLQEYNQLFTGFFIALPSQAKVILVGHSVGGFNLSFTMEHFLDKIFAAVFVTALMPLSGTSLSDMLNEVILVGHSAGGFNLSFTMEHFPDKIVAAVFVTALMPLSGTSLSDMLNEVESIFGNFGEFTFYYPNGKENPTTSFKIGTQFAREFLSQNSPSWDLTLCESLEKKFPLWQEPLLYTAKNYGSVRRIFVVSKGDKLLVEAFHRKMIAENPPQMVYEIEGSDHTVFFSKPLRLAEVLIQIAIAVVCN